MEVHTLSQKWDSGTPWLWLGSPHALPLHGSSQVPNGASHPSFGSPFASIDLYVFLFQLLPLSSWSLPVFPSIACRSTLRLSGF